LGLARKSKYAAEPPPPFEPPQSELTEEEKKAHLDYELLMQEIGSAQTTFTYATPLVGEDEPFIPNLTDRKERLAKEFKKLCPFLYREYAKLYELLIVKSIFFPTKKSMNKFGPLIKKWQRSKLVNRHRQTSFKEESFYLNTDADDDDVEEELLKWRRTFNASLKKCAYLFMMCSFFRQNEEQSKSLKRFQRLVRLQLHEMMVTFQTELQLDEEQAEFFSGTAHLDVLKIVTKRISLLKNLTYLEGSIDNQGIPIKGNPRRFYFRDVRALTCSDTTFDGMNLDSSNFEEVHAEGSSFEGCAMKHIKGNGASFFNSIIGNADFTGSLLSGVDFSLSKPPEPLKIGNLGTEVTPERVENWEMKTNFSETDCEFADFSNRNMKLWSFVFANLRNARMLNVRMINVDFSGADLTGLEVSLREGENSVYVDTFTILPSGKACLIEGYVDPVELFRKWK
jgi:uncharacterized protein YjbI with pentapeptide repeats